MELKHFKIDPDYIEGDYSANRFSKGKVYGEEVEFEDHTGEMNKYVKVVFYVPIEYCEIDEHP